MYRLILDVITRTPPERASQTFVWDATGNGIGNWLARNEKKSTFLVWFMDFLYHFLGFVTFWFSPIWNLCINQLATELALALAGPFRHLHSLIICQSACRQGLSEPFYFFISIFCSHFFSPFRKSNLIWFCLVFWPACQFLLYLICFCIFSVVIFMCLWHSSCHV